MAKKNNKTKTQNTNKKNNSVSQTKNQNNKKVSDKSKLVKKEIKKEENIKIINEQIIKLVEPKVELTSRVELSKIREEKEREERKKETRKISKVIICIVIVLFILISTYGILYKSIKLNGNNEIVLNYNNKYKELGASSKLFGKKTGLKVKYQGKVNTKRTGTYKVQYSIDILIFKIKKYRIVKIVDEEAPLISLKGKDTVVVCPNKKYDEEGYEAKDDYDGDLTKYVKFEMKDDYIVYHVKDKSKNEYKTKRKIIYEDKENPTISLKGEKRVYVKLNSKYEDEGYEVKDNCDENVKVDKSSNVDTTKVGNYTIKYTATDASNNKVEVERMITVYDPNQSGIIYLTFDDGPSDTGSTAKILNVLAKYGIKATFFVTLRGSDSLIKREFDEGHTVALHTASHDYSVVYSSVNNFFDDLSQVQNRVERITGIKSKITRFPGGSNNTVSNRYSYGIMNTLTSEVVNRGFNYYDWNISSGDAGECTTPSCVYSNVTNNLSRDKNNMILMHDIKMFTADAIEDIVKFGINNGYTFRAIDSTTPNVRFK